MIEFVNWHNFVNSPGEINNQPSLTVPDQSYSIRDLLEHFTSMPDDIMRPVFFDDDPDIDEPLPFSIDLTDQTLTNERVAGLEAALKKSEVKSE